MDSVIESIKKRQSVIQITKNKIYGNNISRIILNQRENGGTFRIRNGEIVYTPDDNARKIKFQDNHKRALISSYYRIIGLKGNKVTAECKRCGSIVNDSVSTWYNTRRHLKVCIDLRIERKIDKTHVFCWFVNGIGLEFVNGIRVRGNLQVFDGFHFKSRNIILRCMQNFWQNSNVPNTKSGI